MAAGPSPLSLSIDVARAEVFRMLGYRGREPSEEVVACLDALWADAEGLVDARGVQATVTRADAEAFGMPNPTETVGIGVVTLGPALEARIAHHQAADEALEAFLLDAFGTVAVTAAVEALVQHLCALATLRGCHPSPRTSPGYGPWDLVHQPTLLAHLPLKSVGISLTSGSMMVPQKSLSFGLRFHAGPAADTAWKRGCARCGLADCRTRYGGLKGRQRAQYSHRSGSRARSRRRL